MMYGILVSKLLLGHELVIRIISIIVFDIFVPICLLAAVVIVITVVPIAVAVFLGSPIITVLVVNITSTVVISTVVVTAAVVAWDSLLSVSCHRHNMLLYCSL